MPFRLMLEAPKSDGLIVSLRRLRDYDESDRDCTKLEHHGDVVNPIPPILRVACTVSLKGTRHIDSYKNMIT